MKYLAEITYLMQQINMLEAVGLKATSLRLLVRELMEAQ